MSTTRASTVTDMRETAAVDGPRRRWPDLLRFTLGPLIAFLIVLDAVNGGGSPPSVRSVAALLVWWGLLMGAAFSLGPLARVPRIAVACGGVLFGPPLFTAPSIAGAPTAGR